MSIESSGLHNQIEEQIAIVVGRLESSGVQIIDPAYVANAVDKSIDPDRLSPELKTHVSILQLRQMSRKYLRSRHDPTVRVEEVLSGELDMFNDQLQEYYPATREDLSGVAAKVYVKRHELTDSEIEYNANRMAKAGASLIKHADALLAWKASRAA